MHLLLQFLFNHFKIMRGSSTIKVYKCIYAELGLTVEQILDFW